MAAGGQRARQVRSGSAGRPRSAAGVARNVANHASVSRECPARIRSSVLAASLARLSGALAPRRHTSDVDRRLSSRSFGRRALWSRPPSASARPTWWATRSRTSRSRREARPRSRQTPRPRRPRSRQAPRQSRKRAPPRIVAPAVRRGTKATTGGIVSATCTSGRVVVSASPASGWRLDEMTSGSVTEAKVEFRKSESKVEVRVRCSASGPVFDVETGTSGGGGDGSGSGSG